LFHFTLNKEESVLNPVRNAGGNARSSKERKTETTVLWKQGGGKAKVMKIEVEVIPLFWNFKIDHLVIFCGKQGHIEPLWCIKAKAMASAKKDTKDRNDQ
jgi:hypothetical protein